MFLYQITKAIEVDSVIGLRDTAGKTAVIT